MKYQSTKLRLEPEVATAVAGMSAREITALAQVFAACAGYIAASKGEGKAAANGARCQVSAAAEEGKGAGVLPPVIPLRFRQAVFAALYVAASNGDLAVNPFVAGNLKGGKPTAGPFKERSGERRATVGQSNVGSGKGAAEQCSALQSGPGPSREGPGRREIGSAASAAWGRVTG